MPIDYKKYPKNWKELRAAVLERAKNKCEFCGVENYEQGYWDKKGNFYTVKFILDTLDKTGRDVFSNELTSIPPEKKPVKVVLTIAHLDHDESNHEVRLDRLAALCQRCHLVYDIPEKKKRKHNKKAVGDLFNDK